MSLGGPQGLGARRNKSCSSPRVPAFGRGCRELFPQEDKRDVGGKSDLSHDGSGFFPAPEQEGWVKNPDTLRWLTSKAALEPAGARRCMGEAPQERQTLASVTVLQDWENKVLSLNSISRL